MFARLRFCSLLVVAIVAVVVVAAVVVVVVVVVGNLCPQLGQGVSNQVASRTGL